VTEPIHIKPLSNLEDAGLIQRSFEICEQARHFMTQSPGINPAANNPLKKNSVATPAVPPMETISSAKPSPAPPTPAQPSPARPLSARTSTVSQPEPKSEAATAPAKSPASATAQTSPDQIRQRAYELYVERGYVDGRDEEDWLAAERELRKRVP
jgi:hypothetical protein